MISDEMRAGVAACAERMSAHLVDIVLRGARGTAVVEVVIDAEAGVTTELCAGVSREIALEIDRSSWVEGSYRLEVSSPGIDRPLKFPWQYRKHVGRILKVTVSGTQGIATKTGKLVSADDAGIVLDQGKSAAAETISFDALKEAVVKAPW